MGRHNIGIYKKEKALLIKTINLHNKIKKNKDININISKLEN